MNLINKTLIWIAFLFVATQCFAMNDSIPQNDQKFHDRFGVGIFISPVYSFYNPASDAREHIGRFQGSLGSENNLGIKAGTSISFKINERFNIGVSGSIYRWSPKISYTYYHRHQSCGTCKIQTFQYINNTDLQLSPRAKYYFYKNKSLFIQIAPNKQINLYTKSYYEQLIDEKHLIHYDSRGYSHLLGSPTSIEIGTGKDIYNSSAKKKLDLYLAYSQNTTYYILLSSPGISVNTKAISLNSTYYLK